MAPQLHTVTPVEAILRPAICRGGTFSPIPAPRRYPLHGGLNNPTLQAWRGGPLFPPIPCPSTRNR